MRLPIRNESGLLNKNGGTYLETHSQTNDSANSKRVFEGQIRECYGRVVYSHKTHEKCSDILTNRLSRIKLGQIILSALITGSFILRFFNSEEVGSIIGAALSAILLCLTLYMKDYNLGELAQKHKQAANDIWLIRERYLSLITDLAIGNHSLDALQRERDALVNELHSVYSGAPSTNFKAYREAQRALKESEDMTFSDEEIDAFLPKELKKT